MLHCFFTNKPDNDDDDDDDDKAKVLHGAPLDFYRRSISEFPSMPLI